MLVVKIEIRSLKYENKINITREFSDLKAFKAYLLRQKNLTDGFFANRYQFLNIISWDIKGNLYTVTEIYERNNLFGLYELPASDGKTEFINDKKLRKTILSTVDDVEKEK